MQAFGALAADGTVGLLGLSNHWAWQIARLRAVAATAGLPSCEVLQYCAQNPVLRWSPTRRYQVARMCATTSRWTTSTTKREHSHFRRSWTR
ncbi:hypothetical protein [Kribbella sancticallisti]|uniref:hypothetical protein n=1 Tax=Kribbella sancticallisti TaxID=460087 RepID=UPI0031D60107